MPERDHGTPFLAVMLDSRQMGAMIDAPFGEVAQLARAEDS